MEKYQKKICYAITKANWGGAQRYVYDLAKKSYDDGHEVFVISGAPGILTEKLSLLGISFIHIPELVRDFRLPTKEFIVFWKLFSILRKIQPDVLHVNSSKIGGIGALAGRCAHIKKIIFTAHGWYFKEKRSWLLQKMTFFLSWLTVLLSHITITVSQDDYIRSPHRLAHKKIVLVHNGIDYIEFLSKEAAQKILAEKGVPLLNTFVIGSVGELHHNKGFAYAIEALSFLPHNMILVLIGEGEEQERLQQLAGQYRVSNRVFFLGFIKNAASLLPAFDVFLLSSEKEGFPYTLLEAGMAELPTVATRVGGVQELITNLGTGILVQPQKPKEIKDALLFLWKHSEKRKDLGMKLKEKITKEFTLEEMYRKTTSFYY